VNDVQFLSEALARGGEFRAAAFGLLNKTQRPDPGLLPALSPLFDHDDRATASSAWEIAARIPREHLRPYAERVRSALVADRIRLPDDPTHGCSLVVELSGAPPDPESVEALVTTAEKLTGWTQKSAVRALVGLGREVLTVDQTARLAPCLPVAIDATPEGAETVAFVTGNAAELGSSADRLLETLRSSLPSTEACARLLVCIDAVAPAKLDRAAALLLETVALRGPGSIPEHSVLRVLDALPPGLGARVTASLAIALAERRNHSLIVAEGLRALPLPLRTAAAAAIRTRTPAEGMSDPREAAITLLG
jgi:hypothetical protein